MTIIKIGCKESTGRKHVAHCIIKAGGKLKTSFDEHGDLRVISAMIAAHDAGQECATLHNGETVRIFTARM